jgi:hypothetical protein
MRVKLRKIKQQKIDWRMKLKTRKTSTKVPSKKKKEPDWKTKHIRNCNWRTKLIKKNKKLKKWGHKK